jgi:hypothetical protein
MEDAALYKTVIPPSVPRACDSSSLTPREKQNLGIKCRGRYFDLTDMK